MKINQLVVIVRKRVYYHQLVGCGVYQPVPAVISVLPNKIDKSEI